MKNVLNKLINKYIDDDSVKIPSTLLIDYIGIEIECFGLVTLEDIYAEILDRDLERYVNVGDDGSIETENTDYNTFEFRLLVPDYRLTEVMKSFGKMFKKLKLKTNETCGLHVHIDCRRRDVDFVKGRLHQFQDVLFAMVKRSRWNNSFCEYTTRQNVSSRYVAINSSAYERYRTVEVRLHHGTTNTTEILNWIELLQVIIDPRKRLRQVKKKSDILSWKVDKQLKSYISKKFKDTWFDQHQYKQGA